MYWPHRRVKYIHKDYIFLLHEKMFSWLAEKVKYRREKMEERQIPIHRMQTEQGSGLSMCQLTPHALTANHLELWATRSKKSHTSPTYLSTVPDTCRKEQTSSAANVPGNWFCKCGQFLSREEWEFCDAIEWQRLTFSQFCSNK